VVQTNSTFIKRKGVGGIGKLVKADQGLTSDQPDSSSKWSRAFVQEHLHVEESFVSLDTAVKITDCQSHVGDRRDLKHGSLLVEPMTCRRRSFLPGGAPVRRAGGAEDLLPEGSQPPMPMNSREGGYADASFDQLTLDRGHG
jgi:hypothetical protein